MPSPRGRVSAGRARIESDCPELVFVLDRALESTSVKALVSQSRLTAADAEELLAGALWLDRERMDRRLTERRLNLAPLEDSVDAARRDSVARAAALSPELFAEIAAVKERIEGLQNEQEHRLLALADALRPWEQYHAETEAMVERLAAARASDPTASSSDAQDVSRPVEI